MGSLFGLGQDSISGRLRTPSDRRVGDRRVSDRRVGVRKVQVGLEAEARSSGFILDPWGITVHCDDVLRWQIRALSQQSRSFFVGELFFRAFFRFPEVPPAVLSSCLGHVWIP